MDNQRCTECPAIIPLSKVSKHFELNHPVLIKNEEDRKQLDQNVTNIDDDEEEMDFDLDEDDEDVKDFLEETKDSLINSMDMKPEGEDTDYEMEVQVKKEETKYDCNEKMDVEDAIDEKGDVMEHTNDDEEKDSCPMCDKSVAVRDMTRHLEDIHSVRVLSSTSWAQTSVAEDDPFQIPDFLADNKENKLKLRCHHCQKGFYDVKKLDGHVERRHSGGCKVCRVQMLIQQKRIEPNRRQPARYDLGSEDNSIPVRINIISGQNREIQYSYDQLYPEQPVKFCEECECDFYWPSGDHSCRLITRSIRLVSGTQLRGRMITGEMKVSEEKEFEYVDTKLAESLVRKHAKGIQWKRIQQVSEEIKNLLEELIENVIEGRILPAEDSTRLENDSFIKETEQKIQLSAQMLSYRFILRQDNIPDVVLRAAKFPEILDGHLNETRKLNGFIFQEFKEDIEKSRKEEFVRSLEEKKQQDKELKRELDRSRLYYDYTQYSAPIIKHAQRTKEPPIKSSVVSKGLGLNLSSSKAVDSKRSGVNNRSSKQDRTAKLHSGISILKTNTLNTSLPTVKNTHNTPLPQVRNTYNTSLPTVKNTHNTSLPTVKNTHNTSLPTVKNTHNTSLPTVRRPHQISKPVTKIPPVQSVQSVFPPGLTVQKVHPGSLQAPKPNSALERLRSLGLSVSLSGGDTEDKSSKTVLQKTPSPQTMIVKKVIRKPTGIQRKSVLIPDYRKINSETKNVELKINSNAIKKAKVSSVNKQQILRATKVTSDQAKMKVMQIVTSKQVPQGEFLPKQKLLLKSQILAYRMIARNKKLPHVVLMASTKSNSKELLSKDEQSSLRDFFNMEYSSKK